MCRDGEVGPKKETRKLTRRRVEWLAAVNESGIARVSALVWNEDLQDFVLDLAEDWLDMDAEEDLRASDVRRDWTRGWLAAAATLTCGASDGGVAELLAPLGVTTREGLLEYLDEDDVDFVRLLPYVKGEEDGDER